MAIEPLILKVISFSSSLVVSYYIKSLWEYIYLVFGLYNQNLVGSFFFFDVFTFDMVSTNLPVTVYMRITDRMPALSVWCYSGG